MLKKYLIIGILLIALISCTWAFDIYKWQKLEVPKSEQIEEAELSPANACVGGTTSATCTGLGVAACNANECCKWITPAFVCANKSCTEASLDADPDACLSCGCIYECDSPVDISNSVHITDGTFRALSGCKVRFTSSGLYIAVDSGQKAIIESGATIIWE